MSTTDKPTPDLPDEDYHRLCHIIGEWEKVRESFNVRPEYKEQFIRGKTRPSELRQAGVDKPAVFYCDNGKSLDGLEQGALAVLSNLMMKTNATTAEFMIANDKDGEFHFTCRRGPTTPPVDGDTKAELKIAKDFSCDGDKIRAAREDFEELFRDKNPHFNVAHHLQARFLGRQKDTIRVLLVNSTAKES